MFAEHIARLRSGIQRTYSLGNISGWIQRNTKLNGIPFSFRDHEYQEAILKDQSPEKVVRKCSQVGLTELTFRETLAILRIIDGTTAIYTLPTSKLVEKIVKTRVDPIINDSEDLKFSLSNDVDSSEIKQFGRSFLYFNGTFGQNQAISTPADLLVHDEVDFSNMEVLTSYESRLTHSKYKLRREFSTPTLPGRGISARFDRSRRHFNMARCNHCSDWFLPDYYQHVRIPGWEHNVKDVTKHNIHLTKWREAALHCPHCQAVPDLGYANREWVLENPNENYSPAGYAISPFDAPNIISIPFLVEKSTKYERIADFVNFNLGLPYEDATESLTDGFLRQLFVAAGTQVFSGNYMGCDMGAVCHIVVGNRDSNDVLLVLHYERVPLAEFEVRRAQLAAQFRVLICVMDALPYTDIVMRLQKRDPNLFGGVYHRSKNLATYSIKEQVEDNLIGKLPIKSVMINRNVALDELVAGILRREAVFVDMPEKELLITHMLDMKRQAIVNKDGEIEFVWVKSEAGQDHFMHALLYLATATRLRGMVQGRAPYDSLISTFKNKTM